jgi:hypothetical protein
MREKKKRRKRRVQHVAADPKVPHIMQPRSEGKCGGEVLVARKAHVPIAIAAQKQCNNLHHR